MENHKAGEPETEEQKLQREGWYKILCDYNNARLKNSLEPRMTPPIAESQTKPSLDSYDGNVQEE